MHGFITVYKKREIAIGVISHEQKMKKTASKTSEDVITVNNYLFGAVV